MLSDSTRIRESHSAVATPQVDIDVDNERTSLIASHDTGFGAEYRELARQRRFERSAAEAPAAVAPTLALPRPDITAGERASLRARRGAEQSEPGRSPRAPRAQQVTETAPPAPRPRPAQGRSRGEVHERARRLAETEFAPMSPANPRRRERFVGSSAREAEAASRTAARAATTTVAGAEQTPNIAQQGSRPLTHVERLTTDPMLMIAELSRMADRVIDAREALALATARIVHLERENNACNDRIMAARALVAQAQQTARHAAEQVAFMEGRCDALDQALDLALNASLIQRWKWRRRVSQSVD